MKLDFLLGIRGSCPWILHTALQDCVPFILINSWCFRLLAIEITQMFSTLLCFWAHRACTLESAKPVESMCIWDFHWPRWMTSSCLPANMKQIKSTLKSKLYDSIECQNVNRLNGSNSDKKKSNFGGFVMFREVYSPFLFQWLCMG